MSESTQPRVVSEIKRSFAALLVAVLLAGVPAAPVRAFADPPPSENRVKAAFIYNFLRFTEWPADTAPTAINVGVVGDDASVRAIASALKQRSVGDRPIRVSRISSEAQVRETNVLYVTGKGASVAKPWIDAAAGRPILTITECGDFNRVGSLINFYFSKDTIHFAVNAGELQRSSIKLSSQMLQYATIVNAGAP